MTRIALAVAATFSACLTMVTPALADVCQLNTKEVADKTVKMLSQIDVVLRYCAPCGDPNPVSVPVAKMAAVASPDDPASYEVQINDKGEDLAYLYFLRSVGSKKWVNLGLTTGCATPGEIDTLELAPGLADKATMEAK